MGKPFIEFARDNFIPPKDLNEPYKNGKRAVWIDLAKGICVLFILLYHFDNESFSLPNMFALRMPLFFVISGMFFKDCGDYRAFLIKKTNNLLIPYLFCLVVSAGLIILSNLIGESRVGIASDINLLHVNFPIWFLFCLFLANLIFYILHAGLKKWWLMAAVIGCAMTGTLFRYTDLWCPYMLDSALTALPFLYFGFLLKKSALLCSGTVSLKTFCLGIILIGISLFFHFFLSSPEFYLSTNELSGNELFAYVNSFLIVTGTLMICKCIKWLPIVSYLGRYSIIVLCVQDLIYKCANNLISIVHGHILSYNYYLVAFLILSWLSIPVMRTIIPWFMAQKPLIRIKIPDCG